MSVEDTIKKPTVAVESSRGWQGVATVRLKNGVIASWWLVVWAVGAAVFFRQQWRGGFGRIMGDNGDARLIVYLNENWFQVFHGKASWQNLTFFYPVKDLLGWSDSFFLYQIFYTPARELGFDPFMSLQLTLVGLSLVGFASFMYLARTLLAAPRFLAALGAVVFTFPNNLFTHAGFAQLDGMNLVAAIAALGVVSWRSISHHRVVSTALAGFCGLLWALLFFSTFYEAMFSTLAGAIIAGLSAVTGRKATAKWIVETAKVRIRLILAAICGFGVGLIPFLSTYLPAHAVIHSWTYGHTMELAITWKDLINVGPRNLFWGSTLKGLLPASLLVPSEQSYAVTPIVLVLSILSGLVGIRRWRTPDLNHRKVARSAVVLAGTTVILSVLPLRTRLGSLWIIVWQIPGVQSIRAIDRLQIVTGLVATLTVVAGISMLLRSVHGGRSATWITKVVAVAVLVVAAAEQVNFINVSSVSRSQQLQLLDSVTRPPPACRSFFVTYSTHVNSPFYIAQIDAMLISEHIDVPTLNGYTGYRPSGWQLVQVQDSHYLDSVAAWVQSHHLRGVCELDLSTMTWHASATPRIR